MIFRFVDIEDMYRALERRIVPESRIRKQWNATEEEVLRKFYPNTGIKVIQKMLPGRSLSSIYGRVDKLGIKKNPDFLMKQNRMLGTSLAATKSGVRFRKGHTPMNKGQKGVYGKGSEKGWFKKGSNPKNTKKDGDISIRKDSHGRPYKHIRIAKGKWVHYHRYLWEKHTGKPIPKGFVVTFKDGDSMNCVVENLELISMGENARRNMNPQKKQEII